MYFRILISTLYCPLSSALSPIIQMSASHVLTLQRLPQQPVPQQPLPPALIAEQLGHSICNTHNTHHTSFPVKWYILQPYEGRFLSGRTASAWVFVWCVWCMWIHTRLLTNICFYGEYNYCKQIPPFIKSMFFQTYNMQPKLHSCKHICNCFCPLFSYYFIRWCLITSFTTHLQSESVVTQLLMW